MQADDEPDAREVVIVRLHVDRARRRAREPAACGGRLYRVIVGRRSESSGDVLDTFTGLFERVGIRERLAQVRFGAFERVTS